MCTKNTDIFDRPVSRRPVSTNFPLPTFRRTAVWRLVSSALELTMLLLVAGSFSSAQSVTPTSLSFGNQVIGTASAAKNVTLTNGKKTAITISGIATNLADYTETNNCPATLSAGSNCTIAVSFDPAATGTRRGTLTVTDSGGTQKVNLTGNGILAAVATPTSLSFGNEVIGKKSGSKIVTVKNNQSMSLTLTSITTDLADYSVATNACPISPATLAAGATCKFSVVFTPTALGPRNSTLTIADNASNNPTVSLSGNGVPPVAVGPTSLSFAGQPLGTTSAGQVVTLVNNQSTQITIASITSSLGDFGLSSTCPISPSKLAAGASCSVSVAFSPTATGTRSGTLTFVDNASNSPQTVSLSGTGLPAALVSIAVTPPNPSISEGTTQQFSATGTYTDSSSQDLTSSSTWSSSNTTAATMNASGLATGLTAGSSTIAAAFGTISGSTTLTVTAVQAVLSRVPRRICVIESETATSVSCTLSTDLPAGNGLVVFLTSTAGLPLAPDALQDSSANAYTLLAGPVSGGYGSIYLGYSQLSTALSAGSTISAAVSGPDSWGITVDDIGPVQTNSVDTGVTLQNPDTGLPNDNNPATGMPGWWTGQTTPTTGASDMCVADLGVGPNYIGSGPPAPITTFTTDNNFTKLAMTQFYDQSDPSYTSGGSVLTMYSEVAAGSAVQSHVITSDSIPNSAPAVLYCFKEGPGTVSNPPWFTGNFCTGQATCTINNVAAGDMLAISVHTLNSLPLNPIAISDSQPESITFDEIDGSVGLGTWHISPVLTPGSHTITAADTADPAIAVSVMEIAGQASGNPVEATSQNTYNYSAQASTVVTTVAPNDLLYAWGRSALGSDEGQGFTSIEVAPTVEYALAPAPGLHEVSIRPRGSSPWTATGIQGIAIRPSGTSQSPVSGPQFTGNYCVGDGQNTCTINNVSAGGLLIISSIVVGPLSQNPQLTDSLNEAIVVDRPLDSDGLLDFSMWHIASVANAGSHTFTVDTSIEIIVTEYSAQSQVNPIDAITVATGTTGGFATATVQTSQGNDLIYSFCGTDSITGWGDGFAAIRTSPTAEYKIAASTPGAETATCASSTGDTSAPWVIQELAIKH